MQILSAAPIAPAILRWNYAGYQVLAHQGPHGGAWNSAASALAEWGIFALAFCLVALLFFGHPPQSARLAALAGAAAAVVALFLNHLLGLLWYEPRPYLSSYHVPLLAAAAHGNFAAARKPSPSTGMASVKDPPKGAACGCNVCPHGAPPGVTA